MAAVLSQGVAQVVGLVVAGLITTGLIALARFTVQIRDQVRDLQTKVDRLTP